MKKTEKKIAANHDIGMKADNQYISQIVAQLVDRLVKTYQPEKIILYGSYAYGRPDKESDIDLLIVKETEDRPIDR